MGARARRLSHYELGAYASHTEWAERKNTTPACVQWDLERSLLLDPMDHRAIPVGRIGGAVSHHVRDWAVSIGDVTRRATRLAHEIHSLVAVGDVTAADRGSRRGAAIRYPAPSRR